MAGAEAGRAHRGPAHRPHTRKKLKLKKDSNRQKLQSFTDLSPGDLVVHVHHGIGRFVGITRMTVDGVEKDYIKLDYAGRGLPLCPR